MRALNSDVSDVQGGTTAKRIHLGAMAGTVDIVLRCLTGMRARGPVLRFDPALPPKVKQLRFSVHYRGHRIDLELVEDRAACAPARAGPNRSSPGAGRAGGAGSRGGAGGPANSAESLDTVGGGDGGVSSGDAAVHRHRGIDRVAGHLGRGLGRVAGPLPRCDPRRAGGSWWPGGGHAGTGSWPGSTPLASAVRVAVAAVWRRCGSRSAPGCTPARWSSTGRR